MGQRYLIDTNIISHLFSDKLPAQGKEFVKNIINEAFIISVATKIEVLTYHESNDKMILIEQFVNLADVIPLNDEITTKTIELRRGYRKLKLGDAIIAATAVTHQLTLLTNNLRDFSNIKHLKIIDPHDI